MLISVDGTVILPPWHINCDGLLHSVQKCVVLPSNFKTNDTGRRPMFLNPIYAAVPDHSPSALVWLAFMELSCAPASSFLPSSNGRALTPELGEVLCQHQSGTECCVNFTASCYILVRVWVLWWRWLKVWGYWDTLVWEGKVGGKVLMRITSSGVPPDWVISLVQCCCIHHTPYFGSLGFAF